MDNPALAKLRAIRDAREEFSCRHDATQLRLRVVANGATQRVYQCLRCGAAASRALSKAETAKATGGSEIPSFDDQLLLDWQNAKSSAFAGIEDAFPKAVLTSKSQLSPEAWRENYEAYLASPAWQERRRLVLQRAGGICEGCLTRPATDAHHKTYAHLGEEFLFELLALCSTCHDRYHGQAG